MDKNPDVNFEELACCTDDFNGAQLKAVCFEASMLAFHRDATEVSSLLFIVSCIIISLAVLLLDKASSFLSAAIIHSWLLQPCSSVSELLYTSSS